MLSFDSSLRRARQQSRLRESVRVDWAVVKTKKDPAGDHSHRCFANVVYSSVESALQMLPGIFDLSLHGLPDLRYRASRGTASAATHQGFTNPYALAVGPAGTLGSEIMRVVALVLASASVLCGCARGFTLATSSLHQ